MLWFAFILIISVGAFLMWSWGRHFGYMEGYLDGSARGAEDTGDTPHRRWSEQWAMMHPTVESGPPETPENNESSPPYANGGWMGEGITKLLLALTGGSED